VLDATLDALRTAALSAGDGGGYFPALYARVTRRVIDEGIAILTGRSAPGKPGDETINDAVAKRLKELAVGLKEFAAPEKSAATDGPQ